MRRGRAAGGRHLGAALTAAGLIAGGSAGLELLAEACRELEASPARLELAHAVLERGSVLLARGYGEEAREPLYQALELAEPMGAAPLAERARAQLAELGSRP